MGVLACLVTIIVVPSAGAAGRASGAVIQMGATAVTFTTATFTVATGVPTKLVISTGTDKRYLVPTPDRLRARHVVTVRGLAPDTAYNALVVATPKKGRPAKQWVEFTTLAPGDAPAVVTRLGNKLLLNGLPFYASLVDTDNPCPDQVASGAANMKASILDYYTGSYVPTSCDGDPTLTWSAYLDNLLSGKLWLRASDNKVSGNNQSQALRNQNLKELLNWQAPTKIMQSPPGDDPCTNATNLFKVMNSTANTHPFSFW